RPKFGPQFSAYASTATMPKVLFSRIRYLDKPMWWGPTALGNPGVDQSKVWPSILTVPRFDTLGSAVTPLKVYSHTSAAAAGVLAANTQRNRLRRASMIVS